MDRRLTCVVFADDGGFVARCLDVEVTSDGDTPHAALIHLHEALELHFEDRGTDLANLPARRYQFGQVVVRSPHS